METHPNILKRTIGSRIQKYFTNKMLSIVDVPLVKSLRDKKILEEKYGITAHYIPDGIQKEYLTKPPDPNRFRESFQLYDDFILFIGRLHPAKGPQVIIKSLPLVIKKRPRLKAVFIGQGDKAWLERIAVKLRVHNAVIFTGVISEELKISAIDSSIAVVIPSLYDYVECFSLVTSEAWARKKPVIASAIGELRYRVRNGFNGLLVPPNDPKLLAQAILILRDRCFSFSEKLLTDDEVAKMLLKIYKI